MNALFIKLGWRTLLRDLRAGELRLLIVAVTLAVLPSPPTASPGHDPMNNDNLIRMANQIGSFFESMPDRVEASRDIATHIMKFWDPRMRRALLVMVDSGEHTLNPLVLAAINEHRADLHPKPLTVN